jgi:hypothetical protein
VCGNPTALLHRAAPPGLQTQSLACCLSSFYDYMYAILATILGQLKGSRNLSLNDLSSPVA